MDTDLINWVGVRLRFLGSLLTLPEFGWSFQRFCTLIDFSHQMMCSGAMSHEITPIRGLQVAKSFLVIFCNETKSIGPLGFNEFFLVFCVIFPFFYVNASQLH